MVNTNKSIFPGILINPKTDIITIKKTPVKGSDVIRFPESFLSFRYYTSALAPNLTYPYMPEL